MPYFNLIKHVFTATGCAELYDPITDTICARISSYSETYEDAQAKCESEGSYLLYILDEETHVIICFIKHFTLLKVKGLMELINNLIKILKNWLTN